LVEFRKGTAEERDQAAQENLLVITELVKVVRDLSYYGDSFAWDWFSLTV
jgi:hypothetical protein